MVKAIRDQGVFGPPGAVRSGAAAGGKFETGYQAYQDQFDSLGNFIGGGYLVDINKADAVTLQLIKGIGPGLAKKIIDYRKKNGYFHTAQDLRKINGIGPAMIRKLENQITITVDTVIGVPTEEAAIEY